MLPINLSATVPSSADLLWTLAVIAVVIAAAIVASIYTSDKSRTLRRLRRLLAETRVAVSHRDVTMAVVHQYDAAQHLYATTLRLSAARPAKPLAMLQTARNCERRCQRTIALAKEDKLKALCARVKLSAVHKAFHLTKLSGRRQRRVARLYRTATSLLQTKQYQKADLTACRALMLIETRESTHN